MIRQQHRQPAHRLKIRPFCLDRIEDATGVSGTGIVAVGVLLPSGRAVMEWRSRWKTVTVFESIEDLQRIHGHGGRTRLRWLDAEETETEPFWERWWTRSKKLWEQIRASTGSHLSTQAHQPKKAAGSNQRATASADPHIEPLQPQLKTVRKMTDPSEKDNRFPLCMY